MKDHLVVTEYSDGAFYIVWYLVEEQDFGRYVGEVDPKGPEPNRSTHPDEWECWVADTIAKADSNWINGEAGYCWESQAAAKKVLARINMAFKSPRPLRDWEKKALEAGWKPPKGWNGKI
jgi:hypothetical protein